MRVHFRKQIGSEHVRKVHKIRTGPVVACQRTDIRAALLQDRFYALICGQIGIPKPVNGLLRIAHNKQLAGLQIKLAASFRDLPQTVVLMLTLFLAKVENDFILDRIRVLHFIDKDKVITFLHFAANLGIQKQSAREHQKIVEKDVTGIVIFR